MLFISSVDLEVGSSPAATSLKQVTFGPNIWYQTLPFVMEYELGGDRAVIIVSALVAILSSSTSVSKDNTGTEECLCRNNLFFCTLQLLNGEMSLKGNSSLLRLWPYQGMKHTVSQNGEFIARYC